MQITLWWINCFHTRIMKHHSTTGNTINSQKISSTSSLPAAPPVYVKQRSMLVWILIFALTSSTHQPFALPHFPQKRIQRKKKSFEWCLSFSYSVFHCAIWFFSIPSHNLHTIVTLVQATHLDNQLLSSG